jgi:hypothetical protein
MRNENERRRKKIEARTQNIQQPSRDLSSPISFPKEEVNFFGKKKHSILFLLLTQHHGSAFL